MALKYPWLRRDDETPIAYDTFRAYLDMGPKRSLRGVAEKLGRQRPLVAEWSSKHDWVERVRAFDRHVVEAETDGLTNQLAAARDANLELVDKLRGHLSDQLDSFIKLKLDPTIRWTQALTAMAKLEQNAFLLKDDAKTTERIDNLMAMVEKAVELRQGNEL